MQTLQQSWLRAWTMLGVSPDASLRDRLIACYNEPHRRYHTLQHLHECIQILDPLLAIAAYPGEVEVALWFHDAVYRVQNQDNEIQSACWAKQVVLASGAAVEVAARIEALVLATRHAVLPASIDECVLVDVDLAILGASPTRFEEYEHQIREEYGSVPDEIFHRKRKALLSEFLDRPVIFNTQPVRDRLETQARDNLRRSIAEMGGI